MSAQGHIAPAFGPLELEAFTPAEQAAVSEHVRSCARCSREYNAAADALAAVALEVPPVAPPPELKERVLGTAARVGRFDRFAEEAARIADLGVDEMRALLARIDDAASWTKTPFDGMDVFHLDGGPKTANAIVGFIRIAPNTSFPEHGHEGDETVLVMQGACQEDNGRISRRGEIMPMGPGSSHSLLALPGPPFIFLAVAQKGITLDGEHVGPGDPRL